MHWLSVARTVLELLYFVSGIVIAVAAVLALDQIRVTRQIARTNARRESIKLAADLCKYFAETVVPAWEAADREYRAKRFTFLDVSPPTGQPAFVIQNGEIVNHHFNLKQMAAEAPQMLNTVTFLNYLEAFAIPFAEGVADENIGYRETARPFCQGAQRFMPALVQLRIQNSGRFESVVKLLDIWTRRLGAEMVRPVLKVMQELQKQGEARIKPFDIEV